ncbi:MAG: hypothetical protein H8E55_58170 [Pelagibacterales bacterium]|nr:hypothetical protein [Pelagibacterales bacterium]
MSDLLKQYNLKQSQFDYEVKRAKKNNLKIEEWLRYKYSKKNIELVDKENRVKGRSLVVDVLDSFGQETGFLIDKSLIKRFGLWLKKHKSYNMFVFGSDSLEAQTSHLKKYKKVQYDYYYLQQLAYQEFETLLNLEINIKNTELFWILFGFFRNYFRRLTHKEKEIKIMLKRFDRLNVSLIYRSQYVAYFENIAYLLAHSERWNDFDNLNNRTIEEVIEINKKYSDLDYITIYRGFQLRQGEKNIRDKLNRKKQKVGKGFYYSTNKDYAILYTMNMNIYGHLSSYLFELDDEQLSYSPDEHLRDVAKLKIDRNEFTKNKKYREKISKTEIFKRFMKVQKEKVSENKDIQKLDVNEVNRSIVGTFKVRKKDIIFYSNVEKMTLGIKCGEQSIFCNDNDADLVRYDYVSQKEYSNIKNLKVSKPILKDDNFLDAQLQDD